MKKLSFIIFMLLCVAIFCTLGIWQVKRLHWKQGLIAQLDQAYAKPPEPPFVTEAEITALTQNHFLRGMFRGHLDFPKSFELQGQIDDGKQTSHTIVPYVMSEQLTILVDFGPGFTTGDKDNANTVLTGLLRSLPASNKFTPENNPAEKIFYALDRGDLGIENLHAVELLPEHTPWKDFPAQKPELRNNHLQYAVFWFTMAAVIAALTAYLAFRRAETI